MTGTAASAIKRILNRELTTKAPPRFVLILINVLVIVAPLPSHAMVHSRDVVQRADITPLAKVIDRILGDTALAGGIQGVVVRSLRDGKTWYERNPDLYFMPASNQKLLTSAAALNQRSPELRFHTRLYADGKVDDQGTHAGSLYLEGSGDPTLRESDLEDYIKGLKEAGIRRIRGNVVGDDRLFDAQRYGRGWSWDYLQDYYAAPVSALNLNENVVMLRVKPGSHAGEPAVVSIEPLSQFVIDNLAVTVDEETRITVRRGPGSDRIEIRGTVGLKEPAEGRPGFRISVLEPAHFAAAVLKSKLVQAGIAVDGEAFRGRMPESNINEVAEHRSAPLSEILKLLNKPSNNLIAECLLKLLGTEISPGASSAMGRAIAMRWFKEIGIAESGFDIADGSGLSRLNSVTPRALAKLLQVMHSHPHAKVFADSLPVAGVDGTLRNRMKGTAAEGNCRAKTGYIGGVSSLSGYVTTEGGEPLLFVILMNNHRSRNAAVTVLQNQIVEFLARYSHGKQNVLGRISVDRFSRDRELNWD